MRISSFINIGINILNAARREVSTIDILYKLLPKHNYGRHHPRHSVINYYKTLPLEIAPHVKGRKKQRRLLSAAFNGVTVVLPFALPKRGPNKTIEKPARIVSGYIIVLERIAVRACGWPFHTNLYYHCYLLYLRYLFMYIKNVC